MTISKLKIGDKIRTDIHGKMVKCIILAIHPLGTIDVQVISTGNCFRVSGLPI